MTKSPRHHPGPQIPQILIRSSIHGTCQYPTSQPTGLKGSGVNDLIMSTNSSSSFNVTGILTSLRPSNPSLYIECLSSMGSIAIFIVYTFTNILLLPLYFLILSMGFQQWRRQRSAPAGHSMSHSDVFTYHMVTVEIFGVVGSFLYCLSIFTETVTMLLVGMFVSCVIFPGQTLFHILTCAERYLAVVHPVTYMRLRESGGVRIRNICIMCAWLLIVGWVGVTYLHLPDFPSIPLLCMMGASAIVICFFCLSVLCVLIRPGPGEVGKDKEQVDQSKQRAFHIIRAITGVLLLRTVGLLVSFGLYYLQSLSTVDLCTLMDAGIFLTVPSSLVLPLLFLHKAGKLACCRCNTESG
ncbi:uncharacterized protein LOC144459913 [Epinephelus lanceolatus]